MVLRFVTWNCAGAFARKAALLTPLAPDVAVVCEVRRDHADALGRDWTTVWSGAEGDKGLLIAARAPWTARVLLEAPFRHVVLTEVSAGERRLMVAGIWAMRDGDRTYTQSVCDGLDLVLPHVSKGHDVIIAGDFNASPVFDGRGGNFRDIVSRMTAYDLESLWHTTEGEAFGGESRPTHLHRKRLDASFHIDYVFASSGLRATLDTITIGSPTDWRSASDHMPIIADFSVRDEL